MEVRRLFEIELPKHLIHVRLNRPLGQAEPVRDPTIGEALRDEGDGVDYSSAISVT